MVQLNNLVVKVSRIYFNATQSGSALPLVGSCRRQIPYRLGDPASRDLECRVGRIVYTCTCPPPGSRTNPVMAPAQLAANQPLKEKDRYLNVPLVIPVAQKVSNIKLRKTNLLQRPSPVPVGCGHVHLVDLRN